MSSGGMDCWPLSLRYSADPCPETHPTAVQPFVDNPAGDGVSVSSHMSGMLRSFACPPLVHGWRCSVIMRASPGFRPLLLVENLGHDALPQRVGGLRTFGQETHRVPQLGQFLSTDITVLQMVLDVPALILFDRFEDVGAEQVPHLEVALGVGHATPFGAL